MSEVETQLFAEVLDCKLGNSPIKYLGNPLHYDKLRREDIKPLIDKIIKRIAEDIQPLINKIIKRIYSWMVGQAALL